MISVVIPLFNKSHTIEATLTSVLNQSFSDFEIVIVNDGSTDDSLQVINSFSQDHRIKIFNQSNQGVSSARNQGIKFSTFNYIAFLDGDDLWEPNYLSKIIEAIIKFPNAGMFCCAGKIITGNDEIIRLDKNFENQITPINFFANPHVYLHTSATVVSKIALLKTIRFPVGMKRNQDFAFFFSLALTTEVIYCGFPLSIYVGQVIGQATSSDFATAMPHIAKRFNYVYDFYKSKNIENKYFLIFLKYELRHYFKYMLSKKGQFTLINFINLLDREMLNEFSKIEISLFKTKSLSKISYLYLVFTKIIWRMHGFPRVSS